jgi:hypothetical protein
MWPDWLEGVDLDDPEAVRAAVRRHQLDQIPDDQLESVWVRTVEINTDYAAPGRPAD